jgi:dTDP-D-glucose 4,6-dehydratase
VARFIAREFDYEDKIKFDSNYSDGQYKKTVSNTRLEEFLNTGTTPFTWTSIETGIKQTVKWFLEEKTNIKC